MNALPSFFGTGGEPVPAVDAEDLQTAYEILIGRIGRLSVGGSASASTFSAALAKPAPTFPRLFIAR
jgi:hypothetical protein